MELDWEYPSMISEIPLECAQSSPIRIYHETDWAQFEMFFIDVLIIVLSPQLLLKDMSTFIYI